LTKLAGNYEQRFYKHLKDNHMNKYKRQWDKYSESPLSYDGTSTEKELNLYTQAETKANEIVSKIVDEGIRDGKTEAQIKKEISEAITMQSVGLIYEAEQPWDQTKGAVIEGSSEEAFDQLKDLANLKSNMPRERGILQTHIDGRQPMFELSLLETIADDAWNGNINKKLRRVLEKADRPLGTFLILEFKKHGVPIDEATKQKLEQLNSL